MSLLFQLGVVSFLVTCSKIHGNLQAITWPAIEKNIGGQAANTGRRPIRDKQPEFGITDSSFVAVYTVYKMLSCLLTNLVALSSFT